jgi:hypothetical protein
VYRPARGAGALAIAAGDIHATVTTDGKAGELPPPRVTALHRHEKEGRRDTRIDILAELAAAPPDAAIGVIIVKQAGGKSTALSFVQLQRGDDAKQLEVFREPGRCAFNPKGTLAASVGDKVALVWVDAFGRRSSPSNAVTVE